MPHSFKIPIELTQERDAGAVPSDQRTLRYELQAHVSDQPVTNGRIRATPLIDLTNYRFSAVLDWIAIAVTLPKRQATVNVGKSIKKRLNQPELGGVSVNPLKKGGDRYTREMKLTIQDPTLQRLSKVLDELARRYDVPVEDGRAEHRVMGFELAIDIYPRPSKVKDNLEFALRRVQMSELLRKHFAPEQIFETGDFTEKRDSLRFNDGEGQHQIERPKGQRGPRNLKDVPRLLLAATDPANHLAAPVNATVYLGKRSRPMSYRLQDKVADQRDKDGEPRVKLSPKDRRSRIEVTLESTTLEGDTIPEQLDLFTVDDFSRRYWKGLRAVFFDFECPTFKAAPSGEPEPELVEVFKKTGVIGVKLCDLGNNAIDRATGKRHGDGRLVRQLGPRGHCVAYSELNDRIGRALKQMMKQFEDG
ncbi:hypothetical protein [Salipiger bermudensis]|uniref:hypothetical protein n=1 Tax=Salipiger bermudensis TaxID=344736 RepID=UPI001CD536DB|nr:hypothetical protein [Salipiger bermudensis]MCA0961986.1 hypothetical protein [Salipiger bermudensis]